MQTKQIYKRYSLALIEEDHEGYKSMRIKDLKVSSTHVVKTVNEIFKLNERPEEHLILLCLNVKNYINGVFEVSHGDIDHTEICIANILKRALLVNSNKIIICHNHPSGDTTPSKYDYLLTDRLYDASSIVGIDLLDHIIITKNEYKSILSGKDVG